MKKALEKIISAGFSLFMTGYLGLTGAYLTSKAYAQTALPTVPGCGVEEYAKIKMGGANGLAFDSNGILYVGRDDPSSGLAPTKIVRICPTCKDVREYGNVALSDPDAVVVDREGLISGVRRSVLVGGQWQQWYNGYVVAVLPDETTKTIWAPGTTVLRNPNEMVFDKTGKKLLLIDPEGQIHLSENGKPPQTIINLPSTSLFMNIDNDNNILVVSGDNKMRKYGLDGILIDDSFATNLDSRTRGIAVGQGGPVWGNDIYTISYENLIRIDSKTKDVKIIGTGFNITNDIDFGPDGNLYVSAFDKILRVSPIEEPSQNEWSDNFEDGVIDISKWIVGGDGIGVEFPSPGPYSWTHTEKIAEDGFLDMRIQGPHTANTYGADAWVRSTHNFNDKKDYAINLSWEAKVNASHVDYYAIQLTNGEVLADGGFWWFMSDTNGTKNLYTKANQTNSGKSIWSISIDSLNKKASLFSGANLEGTLLNEKQLNENEPWHLRFIHSDANSAGFPGSDNHMFIYDVSGKQSIITPTPIDTDTPTFTPTPTPTDTYTNTFTPTHTPTDTPTDTPTFTDTPTPTSTPTWTPTDTPTDTLTNTFTFTSTPTPTWTNTSTFTKTPTPTKIRESPTLTPTPRPTSTPTPRPTIPPGLIWIIRQL